MVNLFNSAGQRPRVQGVDQELSMQKYMRKFHADRVHHAMCNIQNCSIPVVQITQLKKLSKKNF
jgi:hypothetical protein